MLQSTHSRLPQRLHRISDSPSPAQRWFSAGREPRASSLSLRKSIEQYSFCCRDLVGQGLTSKVYKGLNDLTGETVCIKVIDLKNSGTPFQLLESQIRLLQQLCHPNIVSLRQAYNTPNNCYIVTEYCEGGDLAALLKNRLRLPEGEAVAKLRDVLAGYKYLVAKGVIHRDIKPANCFLAQGKLKIADFGFAMHARDSLLAKLNVGSPVYMAPESLRNSEYSFRSDIFSIGVLFYELLHGYTPWPCRSEQELLRRINSQPLNFNSSISETSKDFITKCLKISPNQRLNEKDIFLHQIITGKEEVISCGLDSTKQTGEVLIDQYQLKPKNEQETKKKKIERKNRQPNRISLKLPQWTSPQQKKCLSPSDRMSIHSSLKKMMERRRSQKYCIGNQENPIFPTRKNSLMRPSHQQKQHNIEPMLRRISRQIQRQRARIQSQRLSSPGPPTPRLHRIAPTLQRQSLPLVSTPNKVQIHRLFSETVQLILCSHESNYFKTLLEKVGYVIGRLDQLINDSTVPLTSDYLSEEDPYLESILHTKNLKEVCKVAEFYISRLVKMTSESVVEEYTNKIKDNGVCSPPSSLLGLSSNLIKIQNVMGSILNGQPIDLIPGYRCSRRVHTEYE